MPFRRGEGYDSHSNNTNKDYTDMVVKLDVRVVCVSLNRPCSGRIAKGGAPGCAEDSQGTG